MVRQQTDRTSQSVVVLSVVVSSFLFVVLMSCLPFVASSLCRVFLLLHHPYVMSSFCCVVLLLRQSFVCQSCHRPSAMMNRSWCHWYRMRYVGLYKFKRQSDWYYMPVCRCLKKGGANLSDFTIKALQALHDTPPLCLFLLLHMFWHKK